jgi:PEP-CTERM motif-containing protein
MRAHRRRKVAVLAASCILPVSKVAWAQFGAAGTDTTQSLGQFSIVVNPAFSAQVAANFASNYNASANILTSPLLYDPTTTIDRSSTTTVGSAAYTNGLTVGSPANGTVKASSIAVLPTGYNPPAGEDTVFTQIHSFNLSGPGGFSATAGAAASDQPASVGEVVSNATGAGIGNPSSDFPARSFFDIFVDVTVPGVGTFNNSTPLIVDNNSITSFPPVVIYTHGNSTAVPLMFEAGNVFGEPAGTVFGLVTLAGHGAGYTNSSTGVNSPTDPETGRLADPADFESAYNAFLNQPSDLMPLPNVVVTTPTGPSSSVTSDEDTWSTYVPDASVPEPASMSLLAVGAVVSLRGRKRSEIQKD